MSGRIKLLRNGEPINESDTPALPADYYKPVSSDWDRQCGTYGLKRSSEYDIACPSSFVCGVTDDNPELKSFTDCLDSMNCAMFSGMTSNAASGNKKALFMIQMIPHHENAVNMA